MRKEVFLFEKKKQKTFNRLLGGLRGGRRAPLRLWLNYRRGDVAPRMGANPVAWRNVGDQDTRGSRAAVPCAPQKIVGGGDVMSVNVRFEPIKPLIGSIVHVDRADLLDDEVGQRCREMLGQRTVLVFSRLNLTDAEQLAFTDLLGSRMNLTSDAVSDDAKAEDVYKVTLDRSVNRQPEYVLGTFFWHMDGITVDTPPPAATLLSARKVSGKGGQTEFASTFAAYEHLSGDEKAELEGLRAVHSVRSSLRPVADVLPEEEQRKLEIGVVKEHPIVWTRRNGRKSLVIGSSADRVVGLPVAHGRALLTRLVEWAAQPDFSYRHQWQQGDFVIWDNCGALHRVVPYSEESGRMMHRTSIAGTESVN
jgi:alpha-ketoglutarate-dependent taurine dioxygenase